MLTAILGFFILIFIFFALSTIFRYRDENTALKVTIDDNSELLRSVYDYAPQTLKHSLRQQIATNYSTTEESARRYVKQSQVH